MPCSLTPLPKGNDYPLLQTLQISFACYVLHINESTQDHIILCLASFTHHYVYAIHLSCVHSHFCMVFHCKNVLQFICLFYTADRQLFPVFMDSAAVIILVHIFW